MAKHLTEETLWQLAQGETLEEAAREHLEACPACREHLRGTEEGLDLAREASFVPEPSPLYWQAFRRQVERRIAEEPVPVVASAWRRFLRPGVLVPAGVAALVLLLPVLRQGSTPSVVEPTLPAWEALPAADEDGSLDVLRGLALEGSDLAAAALCRDVADCLSALTDEESLTLADALRERLPEGRS